jgi:hypothetical protein
MYVLTYQGNVFYAATDPLRFTREAVKYHRNPDVKIDFVRSVAGK